MATLRTGCLASLLLASLAVAHEPRVISNTEVDVLDFPGHSTQLLSEGNNTASDVAVLELVLPARTFGAPPHVHSREDEHFYVISGEVEFLDRDTTVTGKAGSLIVLPRGHLHGFWNLSDKDARLLLIVTPGKFASFFDDVVEKIRAEHPDNPALVGKLMAQVAAEYDVELHPDKVPASAVAVLPE